MITDALLNAWDDLSSACRKVTCSLPNQLGDSVAEMDAKRKVFDALMMKEALNDSLAAKR